MWDEILRTINHETTPQKAITCWKGEEQTLQLISCGINLVYRFIRDGDVCYLRMTHSKLRSLIALESALAFQQFLQQSSVPVCPLINSTSQRLIEQIQQDGHTFLAHVCAGVPGVPISFDHEGDSLYTHWGKSLAQFHSYQPEHYQYGQWENDIVELESYAHSEDTYIQNELAQVIHYLKNHPQTPQNYGLIHGDHRKGNVLTDGNQIHFIDHDIAGLWMILVGLFLAALCKTNKTGRISFFRTFKDTVPHFL